MNGVQLHEGEDVVLFVQLGIVIDDRRMEIALRPWPFAFLPGLIANDEPFVHPGRSGPARVGSSPHARREERKRGSGDTAHTREQVGVILLAELGQLVEAYEMVSTALVLEPRGDVVHPTELHL